MKCVSVHRKLNAVPLQIVSTVEWRHDSTVEMKIRGSPNTWRPPKNIEGVRPKFH